MNLGQTSSTDSIPGRQLQGVSRSPLCIHVPPFLHLHTSGGPSAATTSGKNTKKIQGHQGVMVGRQPRTFSSNGPVTSPDICLGQLGLLIRP